MKRKIFPGETATKDFHQYMIGAVAPRPIAFVSTIDEIGRFNLAPYSFFNAFSSNPPILVFSSNRRVSNNTTKDTLHNVRVSGECVVNVVNYDIVRQAALSSVEFPRGVSEFDKTGLTPVPSDIVKAPRVKESPINMECVVKDIITLGEHGGAGHLIICEVKVIHIDESVLNDNRIDPHKLDLMGRMGRTYYVRASGDAVSSIYQSVVNVPIGFDNLPAHIQKSAVLTGNDLAALSNIMALPTEQEVSEYLENNDTLKRMISEGKVIEIHNLAKSLISEEKIEDAMKMLLCLS